MMIEWKQEDQDLQEAIREWEIDLNENYNGISDRDIFLKRWEIVKQIGVLSLPADNKYGGMAQSITSTMYALEAFGNICEDQGLNFGVSSHLVSTLVPLQRFGNQHQQEKYLPALCSGDRIGAHAISESESGSDAWSMKTRAVQCDGGYLLNGSKTFISNGPVADTFIVYARTSDKAGTLGGFTAFIVDKPTQGFSTGSPIRKMGLQTSVLCDLYFDDCLIPDENVLGRPGLGFSIFNYVMNWEVLLSFILNMGEVERLLNKCIDYSKSRTQYGQPIANYQAISHKIADMKIGLETAKTMLYKTGLAFQKNKNVTIDLAIAKTVASENYVKIALEAIQIFGGYGYMVDSGIEKYLRNAVASKIYSGTSEIQRNTIASMLGL